MAKLNTKNNSFNIQKIVVLEQNWKNNAYYSYLDIKRPDNGINIILEGTFLYTFPDGSTFMANSKDIVYIPKGINYKASFISDKGDGIHKVSYLINFIVTDEDGKEFLLSDKIVKIYEDKTGSIVECCRKIIDLYRKNRTLKVKSLCYKLFDEFFSAKNEKNIMTLNDGVEYIRTNFNAPLSISTIAQKCALSESTFRRHFKEITKMSPAKYINMLKVEKAKELLKSSEITIDEICEFLNYYDKPYFYKIFKSCVGMTPLEYREKAYGK